MACRAPGSPRGADRTQTRCGGPWPCSISPHHYNLSILQIPQSVPSYPAQPILRDQELGEDEDMVRSDASVRAKPPRPTWETRTPKMWRSRHHGPPPLRLLITAQRVKTHTRWGHGSPRPPAPGHGPSGGWAAVWGSRPGWLLAWGFQGSSR